MTEKTYNILCWNTALSEEKYKKNKDEIFIYIKNFLKHNDNPIVILQQIPYKILPQRPYKYLEPYKDNETSPIYNEFEKHFNEYNVMKNTDQRDDIVMMTVAITNNISIIQDRDKIKGTPPPKTEILYPKADAFPRNRVIALNIGDKSLEDNNELEYKFSMLGLHATGGYANILHLKSIYGVADIILGDFNAGNYEECDNKEVFRTLLSDTHVCILNTPTKEIWSKGKLLRKACIDHVFVKRKYVTKISDLIVHENINYSDHYPITFKITV